MRTLRGLPFNAYQQLVDTSGDPITTEDVPYTIRDIMSEVKSSGTAVYDNGYHTFKATAPEDSDLYWIGYNNLVPPILLEVVDTRLFTVQDARNYGNDYLAQQSPSKILELLEVVEDEFERIVGRSFISKIGFFRDESVDGTISVPAYDVQRLLGATTSDSSATISKWGTVTGVARGSVTATYAYGLGEVPREVKRAGLMYAAHLAFEPRSQIDQRVSSYTVNEHGTFSISTPGRNGAETGLPAVDAVLQRYKPTRGGVL